MNIERFKKQLLAKQQELLSNNARLEEEARDAGEAEVRDAADAATSSQGASESLQEETLASDTLKQVQAALKRMENGTFGKCDACGRPIEAARLEAIPWAAYCLEDQKKQDRATHAQQGGVTL